jgi:hypothetical protein
MIAEAKRDGPDRYASGRTTIVPVPRSRCFIHWPIFLAEGARVAEEKSVRRTHHQSEWQRAPTGGAGIASSWGSDAYVVKASFGPMTRACGRSILPGPYIWRLTSLSLHICPSGCPLDQRRCDRCGDGGLAFRHVARERGEEGAAWAI